MAEKITVDSESSIGPLVGIATRMLTNMVNRVLSENGYDITMEQWIIMSKLWQGEGISQQYFADVFHKNKATITSLLDNMEKRNLVVRIPHMSDRRNKLIYLTPYGRGLKPELQKLVYTQVKQATEGIGESEMETAKQVLRRVINNISGVVVEVKP